MTLAVAFCVLYATATTALMGRNFSNSLLISTGFDDTVLLLSDRSVTSPAEAVIVAPVLMVTVDSALEFAYDTARAGPTGSDKAAERASAVVRTLPPTASIVAAFTVTVAIASDS